jgi:hypothetical protein
LCVLVCLGGGGWSFSVTNSTSECILMHFLCKHISNPIAVCFLHSYEFCIFRQLWHYNTEYTLTYQFPRVVTYRWNGVLRPEHSASEGAVVNNLKLDCTEYGDMLSPIAADKEIPAVRRDDARTGVYSKLRLQWKGKLDDEILSWFYERFPQFLLKR